MNQKEYSPTTKPWSVKDEIEKQVNKESWAQWALKESAPLPKYSKEPLKLTKATAFSFSKEVLKIILI